MCTTTLNNSRIITDSKTAFAEFKYWRNIIVPINKTESAILYSEEGLDGLGIMFSRDDMPFIFYGKIFGQSLVREMIETSGKQAIVYLKYLKDVTKVLKKDVVDVTYRDGLSVEYNYTDGAFKVALTEADVNLPKVAFTHDEKLDLSVTDDEILKLFLDENGQITTTRTHDKLIEFPISRFWSILDKDDVHIRYSDKINKKRYVEVYSKNEYLELHQLFLTI